MTDPLLYDVNLQTCPDAWLCGQWQRRRCGPGPASVFSLASELVLDAADVLTVLGPGLRSTGTWTLERDPRLGRPYLTFSLPQESTRALVTRLQRAPVGEAAVLTLYLQTGTELFLSHGLVL